jgi:hypothetical protein
MYVYSPWPSCSFFVVYGQAFGIIARNPHISPYVFAVNRDKTTALTVESIVSKTCAEPGIERYWNIVGDSISWLNANTVAYVAAKTLAPQKRLHCYYAYLTEFFEADVEKAWNRVLSLKPRYYIALHPDIYPIAPNRALQAVNQLNIPVLTEVQTSDVFEREPPLAEDRGVLIFRRKKIDPH